MVDVDLPDAMGTLPVQLAIEQDNENVLFMLIQAEANLTLNGLFQCCVEYKSYACCQRLLKHNTPFPLVWTRDFENMYYSSMIVVIDQLKMKNVYSYKAPPHTPWAIWIDTMDHKHIEERLDHRPELVNEIFFIYDEPGVFYTPVVYAATRLSYSIVHLLVQRGARDLLDFQERNIISRLDQEDHLEMIYALLKWSFAFRTKDQLDKVLQRTVTHLYACKMHLKTTSEALEEEKHKKRKLKRLSLQLEQENKELKDMSVLSDVQLQDELEAARKRIKLLEDRKE